MKRLKLRFRECLLIFLGLLLFYFSGCKGISTKGEQEARSDFKLLSKKYRPEGHKVLLPVLENNATLSTFLTYAMLNQPRIEAAYYEYAASIENITLGRSLPDPRITFQADVLNIVDYIMPGLMIDIPWPTKLSSRAKIATAESRAKHCAFELAVLQTALDVKHPYYQLHFVQDSIRINSEILSLVKKMEENARVQNEANKATLQDVLSAQTEQERLETEIANLKDSQNPLLAKLKAALGMTYEQKLPPIPSKFDSPSLNINSDDLFKIAMERNPQLKSMEAEVHAAEEGINLAEKSRLPDFTIGAESGVMFGSPMLLPRFDVTLPIWRDKIAAEINAARARKNSAAAKLTSEQIQLAVEFAETFFIYREAKRSLNLLSNELLVKGRLSLEVAQAAYSTGKTDFTNLIDAERRLLEFQLAEANARLQCELALAKLSMIIGERPANAPVLDKIDNKSEK